MKVGNLAYRVFYDTPVKNGMWLKITKLTKKKIICGDWEFDRKTNQEIDECMSAPGSYLLAIKEDK